MLFEGTGNVLQESANLFWDNTNSRLGIGTATPDRPLHINSAGTTGLRIDVTGGGSNAIFLGAASSLIRWSNGAYFSNTGMYSQANDQQYITFDGTNTQVRLQIKASNGNIGIGTTTDAGFKLDVNGTARISGLTRSTDVFVVGGTATTNTANARFWSTGGQAVTSGLYRGLYTDVAWIPSSGSAEWYGLDLRPTINQTGTANGVTRGLYIAATLTAAADFRAIEVVSGITILGASTTAKASLRIPSGTAPTSPVNGDIWFDWNRYKNENRRSNKNIHFIIITMAKIQPIKFPLNQGTATEMSVLILNFETTATTCTTYYELKSEGTEEVPSKVLSNGNYTLTEEEFAAWGESNEWVEQCVAQAIGVTILSF